MGYKNGQIPASALTHRQGLPMTKAGARRFDKLVKRGNKVGRHVYLAQPAGAYRDLETQRDMHNPARKAHYEITIQLSALAAPGASPHGLEAYDLYATKAGKPDLPWLIAVAPKVGLKQRAAGSDPHCFIPA